MDTSVSVTKEPSLAAALRSAVLAQRIYPQGSPIVEKAVNIIQNAAERSLKTMDKLTLTDRQGRLFVNGKEDPDGAALAGVFQELGLQSLTFTPGLSREEVEAAVQVLSRRRADGRKGADLFAEQKLEHVRADRVQVVEVEEGDVVTKKMDALFNGVDDFPALVSSLREGFDMIEKAPSIARQEELRGRMSGRLAAMPSHLLRDLFENPLPKKMEDAGLRDSVLKKMTTEKVHGIFSEIGQWYENIRKTAASDFDAMERLNQLKSFLGKLLGSPASRHVPFAIYEELLQKGLIGAIPAEVRRRPEEEPLPAQVDRLLAGPPASLLEGPTREALPGLFGKLCTVELYDPARELLVKFLDNFYQESTVVRGMAVKTAGGILEALWRCRQANLGDHLFEAVRRLADVERSREVYAELGMVLSGAAVRFLMEDRPVPALELLTQLRRHQEDVYPFQPGRADAARDALGRVARQTMDVLVESALSPDPARVASARNVLYALGAAAAACLAEVLKRATDLRTRRCAAQALRELGEEGSRALAAELTPGLPSPTLLNLLSVAEEFPSEQMVPALKRLMHAPDAFARARIAQMAARIATPAARALLTEMLEDGEETVRIEVIRALGDLRDASAAARLGGLLSGGSVLRREEVCIALGKIGGDAAVPALAAALGQRKLFSRRTDEDETVRVRAAWALSLIPTPMGRKELQRLLDDGNPQVRLIARQTLLDN